MTAKSLMLPLGARIDWERFERLIHERFGVNAVALDKNGNRKTEGDILWANGLCELIKTNPQARKAICEALQSQMISKAEAIKRYVSGECLAGIYRRLVPIIQGCKIEGFISVCGRPFYSRQLMYPDYIHKTTGEEREKVNRLISTVTPIGPRSIKEMTTFITSQSFQ